MDLSKTFLKHFAELEDPRKENHSQKLHNFEDILIITILGAICGVDDWEELHVFGLAKEDWLKTFLKLPNGIPSPDTFSRVFSLIDPKAFETCFLSWIRSLEIDPKGEIIAIDGKTLRGSREGSTNKRPLHLVGAWAAKQNILLGQIKTEEKSNEIDAIPELLNLIDIEGATVTIDAMGCQKKIAEKIIEKNANYVLSLKQNQETLYHDVESIFKIGEEKEKKYKKMLHLRRVEKVHDHGRAETRKYTLISARDPAAFILRWPGLNGIGKLEVTRTINNQVEHSVRYFLTTFQYEEIDKFKEAARQHWNIEIGLHWSLDVSFREDLNRCRKGHSAENLAIVRRIALNLLKQDKTKKCGIKCRRKAAGWDHSYLLQILSNCSSEITTE